MPYPIRQSQLSATLTFHLPWAAKDVLTSLQRRLSADGYMVVSGPRTTGDGYYETCILGPEGIQIEVTE